MKHIFFSKYLYLIFFIIQFSYSFGQPTIKELEVLVSTPVENIRSKMPIGYEFISGVGSISYFENKKIKGEISVTEENKSNLIQFSFFDKTIYNNLYKEFDIRTSKCNLREEEQVENTIISTSCNDLNYRIEILKSNEIVVMYTFIIKRDVKINSLNSSIKIENQDNNISNQTVETVAFTPPVKTEPYQLTKQEKSALNQFLSFCKIQIDVEDGSRYSTNYTMMIIEALYNGEHPIIKKSEIKSKLDEVNTNADLRYKFLTYFTSLIGEETSNLYFILRPVESDTRFVSRISTTDADILSNMMLSHFYSTTFKVVDYTGNTEDKEKSETIVKIESIPDIESEYLGGKSEMIRFIQKNMVLPKQPTGTELGYYSTRFNVSFVVNVDGTLSNITIANHKEELKAYEDAVIECFKKMPKWKPAERKGQKVASRSTQIVNISLKE